MRPPRMAMVRAECARVGLISPCTYLLHNRASSWFVIQNLLCDRYELVCSIFFFKLFLLGLIRAPQHKGRGILTKEERMPAYIRAERAVTHARTWHLHVWGGSNYKQGERLCDWSLVKRVWGRVPNQLSKPRFLVWSLFGVLMGQVGTGLGMSRSGLTFVFVWAR